MKIMNHYIDLLGIKPVTLEVKPRLTKREEIMFAEYEKVKHYL